MLGLQFQEKYIKKVNSHYKGICNTPNVVQSVPNTLLCISKTKPFDVTLTPYIHALTNERNNFV